MPAVVIDQSSPQDPRFNAMDHGFSGETVVVRPEDQPRFLQLQARFNQEWKPSGETERTFVDEMTAHKFQMQSVQAVINKLQAEKGDEALLTDDYRLLRRYLNEHRRDFYRAFNSIRSLRGSNDRLRQQKRLAAQFDFNSGIRVLAVENSRLGAIAKACETEYFRSNPQKLDRFFSGLDLSPDVKVAHTSQ